MEAEHVGADLGAASIARTAPSSSIVPIASGSLDGAL
jgi:hypothetical protein